MASIFTLKAITPKHLPSGRDYSLAIEKAVQKTAALALRDMESTTRTWEHKPLFDVTITQNGKDYSVTAGTDDRIYGYVDAGTRAHVIEPKRSRYLRFQSGYRAKTRVGIIGSREGGPFGAQVFRARVYHPGFPGRKFTVKIQKRRQVTVQQEVSHSIAKVNRLQK